MSEKDLHSNIDERNALDAAEVTGNGTVVGNIIDTLGYEGLEFITQLGTVTTGDFTLLIEESDASNLAGSNVVAAEHRLGSLTVMDTSDQVARIGYIGKKRYVRLSVVGADTSITDSLSAIAILSHPKRAPVAQ